MKKAYLFIVTIAIIGIGLIEPVTVNATGSMQQTDSIPPTTWKEHWFQHNLTLKRVFFDANIAVYYDENMDTTITWPFKIFSDAWAYAKSNYGKLGPERLYIVLHQGTYGGGHPSGFYSATHDYRNTIDCGLDKWDGKTTEQILMPIHEMGHLVNDVSHGTFGSPSDAVWGDSKFMEIFNYDVLMHIGRREEAAKYKVATVRQSDNFPNPSTYWFRDWFLPIYNAYGEGRVLNNYFALLSANFPKDKKKRFTRDLNMGEFVHFWSGAAGVDLSKTAMKTFHWGKNENAQFLKAKKDFPSIKYN
ncbi:MAG: hypothetical protein WC615_08460 [Mucilaginibacter sp.]|jgi:hypothetical protein|uniref:hypothetical protein n=1 Tax=Mucilaginibacter sp. TaxID=1882438 RepID=UPI0035696B08